MRRFKSGGSYISIRAGEKLPENKALSNEGAFVLEDA